MVKTTSGLDFNRPKAFYALSSDISARTGEILSQNTLRRLLGYLSDGHLPHRHTLDVISMYLGYNDWNSLVREKDPSNSSFDMKVRSILSNELKEGQLLVLKWDCDRKLTIRHDSGNQFTVIANENSKLAPGDILQIGGMTPSFPLIAKSVVRNGEELGCYTAADFMGITSIQLV